MVKVQVFTIKVQVFTSNITVWQYYPVDTVSANLIWDCGLKVYLVFLKRLFGNSISV